jgi:hypothetical protein
MSPLCVAPSPSLLVPPSPAQVLPAAAAWYTQGQPLVQESSDPGWRMDAGSKGTENKQKGDQGIVQASLSIPTHGGSLCCDRSIISVAGATADMPRAPLLLFPSALWVPLTGRKDGHTQLWYSGTSVLSPPGFSSISFPWSLAFFQCGSSPSPPPRWRALAPHRVLCAGPQPSNSPALHPVGPGHLCVAGRTPQPRSWGVRSRRRYS